MGTPQQITSFSNEYRFLSNFYLHEVDWGRLRYRSNEHAFQAAKSLDQDVRERIRQAPTPGEAKKLGRSPEKGGIVILREGWDDELRLYVMRKLVHRKFQDPLLRKWLLATGDAYLEEGNWWGDTFWGVCKGVGENWLGKILMDERDWIRGEKREQVLHHL